MSIDTKPIHRQRGQALIELVLWTVILLGMLLAFSRANVAVEKKFYSLIQYRNDAIAALHARGAPLALPLAHSRSSPGNDAHIASDGN